MPDYSPRTRWQLPRAGVVASLSRYVASHRGALSEPDPQQRSSSHDDTVNAGDRTDPDYYTRATALTAPGTYAPMFKKLPNELTELVRIVQGLAIHEFVAADLYGVKIPESRKFESHIRSVERMLERLFEIDDRPLTAARPPEKRLVGTCHHFMMLLLAILRAKGVPVRGRCGFGAYFNPGYFEDHWLCEVWDGNRERWRLVDPQFAEKWQKRLKIDHDVFDVPRDRSDRG